MARRSHDRSDRADPDAATLGGDHGASAPAPSEPRVNKSEEIRVEAQRLLDRGEKPTPKAIIRALGARGIVIVSPQASQVLKRMGIVGRPRRKKGQSVERSERPERAVRPTAAEAPGAPEHRPGSRHGGGSDAFTLQDLIAAKQFAAMAGGPRRAMALLEALEKLS